MRKTLFVFCLWLAVAAWPALADTFALTDGGSVAGEIVKPDDGGVMIHTPEDVYTNIAWARFSQDTLKQLSADPKIKAFVDPFIEPDAAQRPQKAEIQINPVKRLERPENPSVLGGLFKSSVGLFIFLVLYAANLFAAYEISIVKARSAVQVVGAAAVLPVLAPVIFLILPMKIEKPPEEKIAEEIAAEVVAAQKTPEQIQIGEASWKTEATSQVPKKLEPQIYPRGKFTFNKRFIETRFEAFIGAADGDLAKKFSMEVRTMKDLLAVERIAQVAPTDFILETPAGQVTVPFTDIQEIKLNPRPA